MNGPATWQDAPQLWLAPVVAKPGADRAWRQKRLKLVTHLLVPLFGEILFEAVYVTDLAPRDGVAEYDSVANVRRRHSDFSWGGLLVEGHGTAA